MSFRKRTLGAVVFDGFETLDLFGPVQMFGTLAEQFDIVLVSGSGGQIRSRHGQSVGTDFGFEDDRPYDLLLLPGGPGTWVEIENVAFLGWLTRVAPKADIVMSVCTGAAFLAKAGLLDGRAATTNKMEFDWVTQFGGDIAWQGRARWVRSGRYFTSSGVSAGMDMSLAVIAHLSGEMAARKVANHCEYERQTDADNDPFAVFYQTI